MRRSEIMMGGFIVAVIIAGLFGPYMISIGLTVTAALVYAVRHGKSRDAR